MTHFLWRKRTAVLLLGSIVLLLVARPTTSMFWAGAPFVAVGEGIRLWAVGYLTKLRQLVTAGPFAFCRNPIYIGSFLVTIGYFFMCNQLFAWIAGVIVFWVFHAGAVAHEEKLLADKFGEDYQRYRSTVPRWIPRIRGAAGEGRFSFAQFALNGELRVLLGTLLVCVLFGLMAYQVIPLPVERMSSLLRR